jgi:hypothetical protein
MWAKEDENVMMSSGLRLANGFPCGLYECFIAGYYRTQAPVCPEEWPVAESHDIFFFGTP